VEDVMSNIMKNRFVITMPFMGMPVSQEAASLAGCASSGTPSSLNRQLAQPASH
jgi:hypothetical protein